MARPEKYIGIDKDINGGMTPIGRIIRDAWVFRLLPESETCEGWDLRAIDALHDDVTAEWDKYGCMVKNLPDKLRRRHEQIHDEGIVKAKAAGWVGETETGDEE